MNRLVQVRLACYNPCHQVVDPLAIMRVAKMARPNFTADEEALIALIRVPRQSTRRTILDWSLAILAPTIFFIYGLLAQAPACLIAAYIFVLWLLSRLVHAQIRPDWNMKPIIEKYEEACGNQGELLSPKGS